MKNAILFALALSSTAEEVHSVVDDIYRFFRIENTGTVNAADIAASTNAAAAFNSAPASLATTAAPATTAPVTVDKNGMPWDERIHSSSKNFNADGSWRYRKGVDAGMKARVEAELGATMGHTTAPVTVTEVAPLPGLATAAAATLPGLPPIPGATTVAPEETPYTKFVSFLTENTQSPANPAGRLTADWIKAALTQYGIADGSLQNLAHRPDLIPTIEAGIRQVLGL
jgi:hypothetical protein